MSTVRGARRVAGKIRRSLGRALQGPLKQVAALLKIELSPMRELYEQLYEHQGQTKPPDVSIGFGDFDLFGRIELGVLLMEGLAPSHTLCDFGCGTGRLAVHAVPYLTRGEYIGTDIANSMLAHARQRLAQRPSGGAAVRFLKQRPDVFDLPDASVDVLCAFSVFTHMEPEDTYRYLVAARRIVRPGGKLVLSCVPMDLAVARRVFLEQAEQTFADRWSRVRTFTTTTEQMETLAVWAGWQVVRWYRGDVNSIRVPPDGMLSTLGQSVCALTPVE